MVAQGSRATIRHERGVLVEYTAASTPLVFAFEFNPRAVTRTRRMVTQPNPLGRTQGATRFNDRTEAQRVTQGVSAEPETLSFRILLDATDRMHENDPIASRLGVQPEIDTLRSMLEPKDQIPGGMLRLAAADDGRNRALTRNRYPSVLVFKWGPHIFPVFMREVRVEAKEYLPNLHPYRAEATLSLEVIEGENPLYQLERKRQLASATVHATSTLASAITNWVEI